MQRITRRPTRRNRVLAGALAAALLLPASAALASPGHHEERTVATRAEGRRDHRTASRPSVQIDHVYRGDLAGAIGTHTWTGDVFGTGVITTVTYDVALDDAGLPGITNIVVDESTLPEGATYEIRSGTVKTRSDEDSEKPKEEDSEATEEESTEDDASEAGETLVSGSVTTADTPVTEDSEKTDDGVAADDEATDEVVEEVADEGNEEAVTRFAGRAGVRFSMEGRWAGLLILVHGALGDEAVAAVRTVLVSPSMAIERPDDDETTDEEVAEKPDRREKPGREDGDEARNSDERPDRERSDREDRDRRDRGDRGERGERGGSSRDGDRSDGRNHSKPPTGS